MKHPIDTHCQKGFTLIELMISLAILSIGILGIMSMQISAIQGNADTVKFTESIMAAQGQIEFFIMSDYDSITNAGASTADGYTVVNNAGLSVIPVGYTLEYRVITEDTALGTKELNVRVKDGNGKKRTDLTVIKSKG